jgi:hypothetical protein
MSARKVRLVCPIHPEFSFLAGAMLTLTLARDDLTGPTGYSDVRHSFTSC